LRIAVLVASPVGASRGRPTFLRWVAAHDDPLEGNVFLPCGRTGKAYHSEYHRFNTISSTGPVSDYPTSMISRCQGAKALPTRLGEARRELFRLLETRVNPFERTSCRNVPIAT
jgi:hypothetical protein